MEDRTRRGTSGQPTATRPRQRGVPSPDNAGRKISRPTAAGIWPVNPTAAAPFSHLSFVISGHFPATSSHPIAPFHHFWTPELISVVLFLQIPHHLKVTTKTKVAEGWIEFFGHHSDCWTKVMVPMSSWSLGLSIDMWFVNFGCRLVSFPFLGCFRKLPRSRD